MIAEVQEGLFRIMSDENGNDVLEKAGCEDYSITGDSLTYTFKLREYYWNDGMPLRTIRRESRSTFGWKCFSSRTTQVWHLSKLSDVWAAL